jgi:hypothetical protein
MNAQQAARLVLEHSFFGCQDPEQVFVFAAHHHHLGRRRRRRRRSCPWGKLPQGGGQVAPGAAGCLARAFERGV